MIWGGKAENTKAISMSAFPRRQAIVKLKFCCAWIDLESLCRSFCKHHVLLNETEYLYIMNLIFIMSSIFYSFHTSYIAFLTSC